MSRTFSYQYRRIRTTDFGGTIFGRVEVKGLTGGGAFTGFRWSFRRWALVKGVVLIRGTPGLMGLSGRSSPSSNALAFRYSLNVIML